MAARSLLPPRRSFLRRLIHDLLRVPRKVLMAVAAVYGPPKPPPPDPPVAAQIEEAR